MKAPRFEIRAHHRQQARRLNVTIAPSKLDGKKLDVFKNGRKIASIGASGYWDYASYLNAEKLGKFPSGYAADKRKAYRSRHSSERLQGKNSPGYLAYYILW